MSEVGKDDEICIKNEELFIKNEELSIKNEELCIENEELCIKMTNFVKGDRCQTIKFCIQNDDFCIQNDGFCIQMMYFSFKHGSQRRLHGRSGQCGSDLCNSFNGMHIWHGSARAALRKYYVYTSTHTLGQN